MCGIFASVQDSNFSDPLTVHDRQFTVPSIVEYTRSEEHTSELQSRLHLVCRLLLEKKKSKPLLDSGYATAEGRARHVNIISAVPCGSGEGSSVLHSDGFPLQGRLHGVKGELVVAEQ